jgi:glycosyltransferase involved in cell wall biosynthesis
LKILFILPEFFPHSNAGISTYYQHYIDAIRPYCTKIKVIVGSGYVQNISEYNYKGIEVEYLKPEIYKLALSEFKKLHLFPEMRNNLAAAWGMYFQIDKKEYYDVIECTDFAFGFVPWIVNHNRPVIVRLHGSLGQIDIHEEGLKTSVVQDFIKLSELTLLPRCDVLLTHSKANQKFWECNLPKSQINFIRPIFNLNDTSIVPFKERENYALVTGRIQQWKGPIELCRAFEFDNTSGLTINWYGRDMPYSKKISTNNYLKSEFPNIWGKKIIPHKPIANEQLLSLQKKAKFGIITSLWDVFNFSCLEFLSAGTPVIVSQEAGISEIIVNAINGYIYPAKDIKALAECLKKVDNLKENEFNDLVFAGLESVKTHFSKDMLLPQYLNQYDFVIKHFRPLNENTHFQRIYQPGANNYDINELLENEPIVGLINHLLGRLKQKVTRGK